MLPCLRFERERTTLHRKGVTHMAFDASKKKKKSPKKGSSKGKKKK